MKHSRATAAKALSSAGLSATPTLASICRAYARRTIASSRSFVLRCPGTEARLPLSPHVERYSGLVRHPGLVPGRIEGHAHRHRSDAGHGAHRVLDPAGHLAGNRAPWRGQSHVDRDLAVIGDIDPVDQAELIDVSRNLRIVDRLQRCNDIVGETIDLLRRQARARAHAGGVRLQLFGGALTHHNNPVQAKRLSAFRNASTRWSTSSSVL